MGRAQRAGEAKRREARETRAVVAFLHPVSVDDEGHPSDDCSIVIAKQRSGPIGSVPLRFERTYTTFVEREVTAAPQKQRRRRGGGADQRHWQDGHDEDF